MIKSILVATDGSAAAEKAAGIALDYAKQLKCEVLCLNVVRPLQSVIGMRLENIFLEENGQSLAKYLLAEGQKSVDRIVKMGKEKGVPVRGKIEEGERVEQTIIASALKEKQDMIVVATHGQTGFLSEEMGTVTRRLLASDPPCPVVVVPFT